MMDLMEGSHSIRTPGMDEIHFREGFEEVVIGEEVPRTARGIVAADSGREPSGEARKDSRGYANSASLVVETRAGIQWS